MAKKFSPGDKVDVRYEDGARYPAVIIEPRPRPEGHEAEDGDNYVLRWEPPYPNIPPTWIAHEDDIRKLR